MTRGSFRRILDGAAVAVVVTALLVLVLRGIDPLGTGGHDLVESALPLDRFVELASTGQWIGPQLAPVVILIYSDYSCGPSLPMYRETVIIEEILNP